jgi:hypothetical protein
MIRGTYSRALPLGGDGSCQSDHTGYRFRACIPIRYHQIAPGYTGYV